MEYILSAITMFQKGGIVMYILLLCSIFVIAIGIERGLFFYHADSGRAFSRLFAMRVYNKEFQVARDLAGSTKGALADIITDGLNRYSTNSEKLNSYLEVHSGIALAGLRKRLYYLSVIVTMAPLLGLLGTISGMISSFSVFNLESGQATAITGGVGEALIATAMGLCVAIIALVVHSYYTQRIDAVVTDMEQCFSLIEDNRAAFAETSVNDIQTVSQKAGAAA